MNFKKISTLMIFLFLIILFLGFAGAESCDIRLRTNCQTNPWNNILMGLSDYTNAHGQTRDITSYEYVLCCDFERTYFCNGNNEIIVLSDTTNAHAEIPDAASPQYTESICYGDLECRSTAGDCSSAEIEIFSLSTDTNAHIGEFGDYNSKICCSGISYTQEICNLGEIYVNGKCVKITDVYWANEKDHDIMITETNVEIGITNITMILKTSGLLPGGEINFEIYEDDFWTFDDEIRVGENAIPSVVDSNGNVNATWIVLQEDLDKTVDLNDFYFKVLNTESEVIETSGDLKITTIRCEIINYCMNYLDEQGCNSDSCLVASNSLSDINCDDPTIICECQWSVTETEEKCKPLWKVIENISCNECEEPPKIIGSCLITETTEDNCDDGFLTYLWEGSWIGEQSGLNYENCVKGGRKTIPCQTRIQLPFFGTYNVTFTIILIVLIYISLHVVKVFKNHKKKSKE